MFGLQNLLYTLGLPFAIAVLYSLLCSKSQCLGRVVDIGNNSIGVDHSFGYERVSVPATYRISPVRLGCGTHYGTHIRLIFIGHCLAVDTVDHCGSTYTPTRTHINLIASNSYQCPCRGSIVVDKSNGRQLAFHQQRSDRIGILQLSAISIDRYDEQVRIERYGFRHTFTGIYPHS